MYVGADGWYVIGGGDGRAYGDGVVTVGVTFQWGAVYQDAFLKAANRLSAHFSFVPGAKQCQKRLIVNNSKMSSLFRIGQGSDVAVSLWQAEEICEYAGLGVPDYLVVSSLMGLMQDRALERNPDMRPDDFLHESRDACLFGTLEQKSMAALKFEQPSLCSGCLQFYACIGLESEALTLMSMLGALSASAG